MAFVIKGKLEGLDDVIRQMQGIKKSVRNRALRAGVTKAARILRKAARANIKPRTGLLKKSLDARVKVYKQGGIVVAVVGPKTGMKQRVTLPDGTTTVEDPAKIAHFVEKGRQGVRVKTRKVLSNGAVIFGRAVKAFLGRPFLRPAFDLSKTQMQDAIREELRRAIAKHKG